MSDDDRWMITPCSNHGCILRDPGAGGLGTNGRCEHMAPRERLGVLRALAAELVRARARLGKRDDPAIADAARAYVAAYVALGKADLDPGPSSTWGRFDDARAGRVRRLRADTSRAHAALIDAVRAERER